MKKGKKETGPHEKKGDRTEVLAGQNLGPLIVKKARFTVKNGKDAGKELVIQKAFVMIGTLPGSDLVLTDPTVSRRHAEVEERSDGYVLRDHNSTNGTFLDGVRVREAYLSPGSVIRLGQTEMTFSPLEERIEILQSSADSFGELIGSSSPIREVYGMLERIAPTDVTVLLEGETGTGKELAARAIHSYSRRAAGPFVVFDCGAVAPNLIESELFGHEKGAFTDAVKVRQGAFELADKGTIFLDEIGELSPDLQPKLLRALDQRETKRVGADKPMSFNVRVISATNKDLGKEVKAGRFREDLFYRLSVVRVSMPPLRKRKEDIETIAGRLLAGISAEIGKKIAGLSPEAAAALTVYSWPGNVRELRNVLGRAAALSDSGRIDAKDLFLSQGKKAATFDGLSGKTLEEIEKAAIAATLKSADGNKTETAKVLGIAYSTLYEKMKKYGMRE
ncbi:MAG: sigma 54-dependent Fis family transcriptional regulator [Nitrospirae bacterium]|nr:sigma 54-dependent Fis family transcriptional regulator [Nitrospirota bacterium]